MLHKKNYTLRILAVVLTLALMFGMSAQTVFSSSGSPTPVDGRVLPRDKAGDTSAWVEIAKYGDYSLIIRQEPLTSSVTTFSAKDLNNVYFNSQPRTAINNWFRSGLSSTARLRDFTMRNNAMSHMGSYGMTYVDGISQPVGGAARTGDDVAFALSFCEAALYCSTQYVTAWTGAEVKLSSQTAYRNYHKLMPKSDMSYWLRSPGAVYYAACSVTFQGGSGWSGAPNTPDQTAGRATSSTVIGTFGHYRPALWVGSGIFEGDRATVRVIHRDAANPATPLQQFEYTVSPGSYGPYGPLAITGYTYTGLASGSDPISGSISAGQTRTIIHQYNRTPVEREYTVTYYANNGTSESRSYTGREGTVHFVFDQGFSNGARRFVSWNTQPNGSGATYNNSALIVLNSNINLFAQWSDAPSSSSIVYHSNFGADQTHTDYGSGGYFTILSGMFNRPGFIFRGWNSMPDGRGATLPIGYTFGVMVGTLHLYAVWSTVE